MSEASAAKRLDDVHWEGIVACFDGAALADNPYEYGSNHWWMWRLSYLAEQEREEWEASLPRQAEKAIEEQPNWEKRERLGVNDLVRRVKHRADALARWLGNEWAPDFLIEQHGRKLLKEAVDELLAIRPRP